MKKLLVKILLIGFSLDAFAVININNATSDELQTLENVGPVKAEEIIKYRKKHGPFKNIDELDNVLGITPTTFEMNKKNISISDVLSYTVIKGDTLSKIAKTQYGKPNDYMKIFEVNRPKLNNPDKIYPGQLLQIPL